MRKAATVITHQCQSIIDGSQHNMVQIAIFTIGHKSPRLSPGFKPGWQRKPFRRSPPPSWGRECAHGSTQTLNFRMPHTHTHTARLAALPQWCLQSHTAPCFAHLSWHSWHESRWRPSQQSLEPNRQHMNQYSCMKLWSTPRHIMLHHIAASARLQSSCPM